MIRRYFHTLLLLSTAWTLYALCQGDTILPLTVGGLAVLSFFTRLKTHQQQFPLFSRIPLSGIIIWSFVIGLFWRTLFPVPEESVSPYPLVTAGVQSGSILAALLIWLKPFSKKNAIALTFAAWITTATSINVPFRPSMFQAFSTFCILAVALVILDTIKKPQDKKRLFTYYRDYAVFPAALILTTSLLFVGISRTVMFIDQMTFQLLNDYLLPGYYTNFLRLDPFLRLESPGDSAFDRRPVMEITLPGAPGAYLKLQVFDRFRDGIWEEIKNDETTALPQRLDPALTRADIMMFTSLKNIVPSPGGITAGQGPGRLRVNGDGLVFTDDERHSRILSLSVSRGITPAQLSSKELSEYLRIPDGTARDLKELSDEITGEETSDPAKAQMIEDFFQNNFQYSLSVTYRADERGLIDMIRNRRPAYCSYFASAMTLLLRAQGIPARVVTGFLTNEIIDAKTTRFLARVKDAHAWTEALLPATDPRTGQTVTAWQRFDGTPSSIQGSLVPLRGLQLQRILDSIGLAVMRLAARVENINRADLKRGLLYLSLAMIIFINRRKIWNGIRNIRKKKQRPKPPHRAGPEPLLELYKRYEFYLKTTLSETRSADETDDDVVARLKKRPEVQEPVIEAIEAFLSRYRAARFGRADTTGLEHQLLEITR